MQYTGSPLRRINHLVGEIDALYHEAALRFGLPDSAMMVLYTVSVEGGVCPIGEIVRQCGVSKQTINSALRRLEADGVIALSPQGGKSKCVHLTEAGEALTRDTVCRLIEMENGILSSWTAEEQAQYLSLMQRYHDAFQAGVEELA